MAYLDSLRYAADCCLASKAVIGNTLSTRTYIRQTYNSVRPGYGDGDTVVNTELNLYVGDSVTVYAQPVFKTASTWPKGLNNDAEIDCVLYVPRYYSIPQLASTRGYQPEQFTAEYAETVIVMEKTEGDVLYETEYEIVGYTTSTVTIQLQLAQRKITRTVLGD